jgi:chromosomal replication initiator protein
VAAYSSLNNEPVTIEMASNVLREFFSQEDRDVSIEKIIKRVSEHFRVKTQDLLGNSRSRSVAMPRQIAMYLSRELTHHSFPEIGSFFGKKDHSTIMHACRKIGKECEDNEEFRRFIEGMVQRIKNEAA